MHKKKLETNGCGKKIQIYDRTSEKRKTALLTDVYIKEYIVKEKHHYRVTERKIGGKEK